MREHLCAASGGFIRGEFELVLVNGEIVHFDLGTFGLVSQNPDMTNSEERGGHTCAFHLYRKGGHVPVELHRSERNVSN